MSSNKRVPSIPWQDFDSCRKAKHLLDTGLMADCSFLVGEEPKTKRFDCHKIILISASPVFETMFCGGFKESNTTNPIPIPDAQPEVFRLFLEFIYDPCQSSFEVNYDESCSEYSDEEDCKYEFVDSNGRDSHDDVLNETFKTYNFETLKNLLYLGNKYMIKSLGRQCCLALNQQLPKGDQECILRIFELAIATDHKSLAKKSARHFEQQFYLVNNEAIFDLDALILCEFLKCLELTKSKEVLETIDIYIERNSLNINANDANEFEYGICKSCENPFKRQRKESATKQKSRTIQFERVKNQDSSTDKHLSKRTSNCETGKSHVCPKKQKLKKTNDAEPSTSKYCGANNNQSHGYLSINSENSSGNNCASSMNSINSSDRQRNLEIIKQLYESVNFSDMDPIEFSKAAKKPGLSEYLSDRRKYEILENLCKNYQRSHSYQRHQW